MLASYHTVLRRRAAALRRRALEAGCALGLALTVCLCAAAEHTRSVEARVCADTLRLHILANSDTVEDQLLKLEVRDAMLGAVAELTADAPDKAAAVAAVRQALPRLTAEAKAASRGQNVCVRLEEADFPARDYGTFRLPAGRYTALRVELGEARGHNWFCVLYPALCVGSCGARYDDAAENALVFGGYEVRFALLDTARALASSFSS